MITRRGAVRTPIAVAAAFAVTAVLATPSSAFAAEAVNSAPVAGANAARVAAAKARFGDYYAKRLAMFLEDTPRRAPGGIVFVGDSITDQSPFEAVLPGMNAVNRGIGGDVLAGVQARLDVSVTRLRPKTVCMMIGVNNFAWSKEFSTPTLLAQYPPLLAAIAQGAPEARRVLFSVLPVSEARADADLINSRVAAVDAALPAMAAKAGFEWIDLRPRMTDAKGRLAPEYATDGVHLTPDGYLAWLEMLVEPANYGDTLAAAATHWAARRSPVRKVDGVNTARGEDQVIVFTRDGGATSTRTNEWGKEAVVERGRVVRVATRDSAIPLDGFVVSAHGTGIIWLNENLRVGARVAFARGELRVTSPPPTGPSTRERLDAARGKVIEALSLAPAGKREGGPFADRVRAVSAEIATLGRKLPKVSAKAIAAVDRKAAALVVEARKTAKD